MIELVLRQRAYVHLHRSIHFAEEEFTYNFVLNKICLHFYFNTQTQLGFVNKWIKIPTLVFFYSKT